MFLGGRWRACGYAWDARTVAIPKPRGDAGVSILPLESFASAAFWTASAQIVLIDLLLGGDNAVVIAMASRRLAAHQRRRAIMLGTVGAVGMRIVLTLFAVRLLELPGLKLAGGLLLGWIGMRLMLPEAHEAKVEEADELWSAVRIVIVADLIMSLDNVVAIAAAARNSAAEHEWILVIFGLVLSVPIIVWGSSLVIGLITRFPVVIVLGAMMLGWIAGGLCATDPLVHGWLLSRSWGGSAHLLASAFGLLLVWLGGSWMRRHRMPPSMRGF
jgi:YjbE family integral membrane protein